jgi:hypothetical protein
MVGSSVEREAGIVVENEVDTDHFFSQLVTGLSVTAKIGRNNRTAVS